MDSIKSCIFIDFDNVFSGLAQQSPNAAKSFAMNPMVWVKWLENYYKLTEEEGKRKILVRKCYMNPHVYGEYRPYFVKSSFQVIDCPPLAERGKNGADIHMVVDILGYLDHKISFDEFIIMSSDSDFTPILVKLRENDKSTFIISTGLSSITFRNSADIVMDQIGFIDILESFSEQVATEKKIIDTKAVEESSVRSEISKYARDIITENGNQVIIATLATKIKARYGNIIGIDGWFGKGKFSDYLLSLSIPNIEIDYNVPGYVKVGESSKIERNQPKGSFLGKIHQILDIPIMKYEIYTAFFEELKKYTDEKEYSLNECSKTLRDNMEKRGYQFSRVTANFILVGLGRKNVLNKKVSDISKYKEAFYENVITLIENAQIEYTDSDIMQIKRMLGIS